MRSLLFTFLLLALGLVATAQPGTLDFSFNSSDRGFHYGDGANGTVRTIAVLSSGQFAVGGDFTTFDGYGASRIAILLPDGRMNTFYRMYNVNGPVNAVAALPGGGALAGGDFYDFNGDWYTDYLAQVGGSGFPFNRDSGPDGIPEGPNSSITAIVVQPDGKILIGGGFMSYNRTRRNHIARLQADGSLDTSFKPVNPAGGTVTAIALQPDGKVLVGGWSAGPDGNMYDYLSRLNSDGSADTTFRPGSGANNTITSLVVQADGRILVGGTFTSWNGAPCNRLVRLNSDGLPDASFAVGSGANSGVRALALYEDGRILVGGEFTTFNGASRQGLVRLHPDGVPDASFPSGSGVNGAVYTMARDSAGRMLIGGSFTAVNGITCNRVARLLADGSPDRSFGIPTGANGRVNTAALQPDGRIVIGGGFTMFNRALRHRLARVHEDGTLDESFDPGSGADTAVQATVVQSDGKIVAGGWFTSFNGTPRGRIVRLESSGRLDPSFGGGRGANGGITAVALQPDGRMLVGGVFTAYDGTARNRIARLHADGSLDPTFNPGSGATDSVYTIALQPDGKVLVGGAFTSFNGSPYNHLVRLNADGSVDASFTPGTGANKPVRALAVQGDGKILIGGQFTAYNGTDRFRIARLHSNGTLDTTFRHVDEVEMGVVHSVALQSDGNVIIGGEDDFIGGNASNSGVARLDAAGVLDPTFRGDARGPVYTVQALGGGKVLAGGDFVEYGNYDKLYGRNRLARIHGGTNSVALGTVTQTTLCAGSSFAIPVTATGTFASGNRFIAYLSTASGSFDTSFLIGELTASRSDTIRALVPDSAVWGSGYKIMVYSSQPYTIAPDNALTLTVKALVADSIKVGGDTTFCAGGRVVLTAKATTGVQWYRNGEPLSGATTPSYTATQTGRYFIGPTPTTCVADTPMVVTVLVKPAPAKPVITAAGATLSSSAPAGNQWFLNGAPIAGATGPQLVAQTAGNYSVQVTQEGCSTLSDPFSYVLTGIVDPSAWNGEVIAYPNPVGEVLYLTNSGGRKLAVELLDGTGKKVAAWQIASSSASLPLQGLARGTYVLLVTDVKKKETLAQVVVKQ